MKKRMGWIVSLILCMAVSSAAAQEMDLVIDEKANRVTGHFTGPVVEALDVDMPIPQEVPEHAAFEVKDIRITQNKLEQALSGLIYNDHVHNFNIDPGDRYSNYVYEDMTDLSGYEYMGAPLITDRLDKAKEVEQAQAVAQTFLNRLGIPYIEPFYFVGRKEDFFSRRYPQSKEEAEQWERSGAREAWDADKLTMIVAHYNIGGLPQGEWFVPNAQSKDGYDYGGAVYIVVDDEGKIVFAKLFSPRQYVKDAPGETRIISWQTALEAAITYVTQTPFPAKSIRNYTGTYVYMELCVFADQKGRTYPMWRLMEERFYEATDFKGNKTTRGGSTWLYVDAITGMVMP